MSIARLDIDSYTDRLMYKEGYGHLIGLPTQPGVTSAVTTGIPTNGTAGFAPGCLFLNFKGGPSTAQYVNIGTNASSQWINVDSPDGGLVTLAAAKTLSALMNSGRTMLLALAGGFTTTLPAATGTGNIYRFIVFIVSTTGYVIKAAGSDVYKGSLEIDASATVGSTERFVSTANQNITLNGTTTGGVAIGDWIQIQDIASGVWAVTGLLVGSGTLATPFS
jgi:hypothetical protein